jgi:hypothetical protein
MPDNTPSLVFPIPGYKGSISPHGAYNGGSDIPADTGLPVVSMVSGVVDFISTESNASRSGGNAISIHGDDGKDYYYAHLLNPPSVGMGAKVVAGQQLGQVDTTGNAKGGIPHLHIGIGYGITSGVRTAQDPSAGGLGKNFDAVAMLRALVSDPRANDPALVGGTPNPPQIQFVPNVPGFDSAHLKDIELNVQKAIEAGVDPFLWLGIVSKESSFDPGAINPKSGACGYSQIYPCIPNLTPEQNIAEGLKRFKDFLATCQNSVNCALNLYSGGGGPLYASDVQGRASAIQSANPSIASGGFHIPTVGGGVGTPGAGQNLAPPIPKCPPQQLGSIGPWDINFPDLTCIVGYALKDMTNKLTHWFSQWQTEHVPNWTFVILGIILVIVGGLALANSSGMQAPNINMASGGAVASAAKASPIAEVAAVA